MKKIVIALDSFKGCLTSAEAGEAAAQGVRAACPECRTIVLPVADGGEGMLDVLLAASNGKRITVRAHDPLMQPCDASYGISGDGNTAFIEMAAISGLPLVPADKRNPMKTTTFGTGELIRDALERRCLRFVIGLGGSATNDAGLGMLQALGFRFFDKEGHEVGSMEKGIALCGALLSEISSIDSSSAHPALKKACFTAACDVRNPFFGPNGAAHVFAPQKGCRPPHHRRREIGPADSYGESTFGHLAGSKEATYSRHPAGRSDRGCRDTECSRIPGRIVHYPLSRLFGAGHAA